jgi:hypothetical protein
MVVGLSRVSFVRANCGVELLRFVGGFYFFVAPDCVETVEKDPIWSRGYVVRWVR